MLSQPGEPAPWQRPSPVKQRVILNVVAATLLVLLPFARIGSRWRLRS